MLVVLFIFETALFGRFTISEVIDHQKLVIVSANGILIDVRLWNFHDLINLMFKSFFTSSLPKHLICLVSIISIRKYLQIISKHLVILHKIRIGKFTISNLKSMKNNNKIEILDYFLIFYDNQERSLIFKSLLPFRCFCQQNKNATYSSFLQAFIQVFAHLNKKDYFKMPVNAYSKFNFNKRRKNVSKIQFCTTDVTSAKNPFNFHPNYNKSCHQYKSQSFRQILIFKNSLKYTYFVVDTIFDESYCILDIFCIDCNKIVLNLMRFVLILFMSLQQYKNNLESFKWQFGLNQPFPYFPTIVYCIQYINQNNLTAPYMLTSNFQLYPLIQKQKLPLIDLNRNTIPTTECIQDNNHRQSASVGNRKSNQYSVDIISRELQYTERQIGEQIKSRNILPNNVNLVLSCLRRINKSGKIVANIINKLKKQGQPYDTKKFYSYQLYLKDNIEHHLNRHAIRNVSRFCDPSCSIFSIQEQMFYNKVFRIAAYHFLRDECILSILSSKKMYKTRRIDHLKSYRVIMADLKRRLP